MAVGGMLVYEKFAALYDELMEVDYEAWLDTIEGLWQGKRPHLVLDLCCGSGGMTAALEGRGYTPIGVDVSAEMLAEAREKLSPEALLLCQDMRELDLYGTVDAALCLCDSLNYLETEDDLRRVFQKVNLFLEPGGLFIFDMNTPYQFAEVLGENTFAETTEDAAYIWENDFDPEEGVNTFAVTFFARQPDGSYERFFELHEEFAYPLERVWALLKEAGLIPLAVYDGYTGEKADADCGRWLIVARESGKAPQTTEK